MENSKNDYLSIGFEISLSKKDCMTTPKERECMSRVSYTSAVGSVIYTMICTRSDMAYSLAIVCGY